MIFALKFLICVLLGIDALGSYRMLADKWTAVEELFIWLFVVAKLLAIVWILAT